MNCIPGTVLGFAAAIAAAGAFAQAVPPPPPPGASAPPPPGAPAPAAATFKQEELEQLAAPIALYPDALVAQILMASTYPLEVVEAARWSKANPKLKDKALEDALQQQRWDPSVKSLTALPQVLAMMDAKLDWTQKLGDAFLAQQKELMAAVQRLRAKAYAAGNLKSGKEQTIKVEQQDGSTVYIIEPASPQVVYVPTYNPTYVYGPWPYPAYPPYYYYPPGYVAGPVFVFSVGIIVGSALWGGCRWGGGNVYINHNTYNNFNRTNINNGNWEHKPEHRKGAQYRDTATQQRYGGGAKPGVDSREAYRGRDAGGGQDLARGGGDKFGQQDRAGDRAGGAGGFGDRAGGGGREAGAFDGVGRGGETRDFSNRGATSRASAGASRGGGGGRRR